MSLERQNPEHIKSSLRVSAEEAIKAAINLKKRAEDEHIINAPPKNELIYEILQSICSSMDTIHKHYDSVIKLEAKSAQQNNLLSSIKHSIEHYSDTITEIYSSGIFDNLYQQNVRSAIIFQSIHTKLGSIQVTNCQKIDEFKKYKLEYNKAKAHLASSTEIGKLLETIYFTQKNLTQLLTYLYQEVFGPQMFSYDSYDIPNVTKFLLDLSKETNKKGAKISAKGELSDIIESKRDEHSKLLEKKSALYKEFLDKKTKLGDCLKHSNEYLITKASEIKTHILMLKTDSQEGRTTEEVQSENEPLIESLEKELKTIKEYIKASLDSELVPSAENSDNQDNANYFTSELSKLQEQILENEADISASNKFLDTLQNWVESDNQFDEGIMPIFSLFKSTNIHDFNTTMLEKVAKLMEIQTELIGDGE